MSAGAAQMWFVAGAIVLVLAGGLHAIQALLDTIRPRAFAPIDRAVKPAMEGTGIRLRRAVPGGDDGARPSLWRVWLGVHIGFGLGIFTFGLVCLLIATHDFALVERLDALRPLAIGFSAAFLALSLRFFFYAPTMITAAATVCFTIAAVLSA